MGIQFLHHPSEQRLSPEQKEALQRIRSLYPEAIVKVIDRETSDAMLIPYDELTSSPGWPATP